MLQPFAEGKAVIQVVLPPSWVTRINRLARERGVNRSALIRAAIHAAYFPSEPADAADAAAPAAPRREDTPAAPARRVSASEPRQRPLSQPVPSTPTDQRSKRAQRRTGTC